MTIIGRSTVILFWATVLAAGCNLKSVNLPPEKYISTASVILGDFYMIGDGGRVPITISREEVENYPYKFKIGSEQDKSVTEVRFQLYQFNDILVAFTEGDKHDVYQVCVDGEEIAFADLSQAFFEKYPAILPGTKISVGTGYDKCTEVELRATPEQLAEFFLQHGTTPGLFRSPGPLVRNRVVEKSPKDTPWVVVSQSGHVTIVTPLLESLKVAEVPSSSPFWKRRQRPRLGIGSAASSGS